VEGIAMLLRDNIYKAIRQAILTCEFEPGQELREQTLADRYRVSRSPVRDALLRLEQENLVTVLPRQGYLVNAISIADVENMYGLRLLLEPACTALAARADDTVVRTLNQFRGYQDNGDPEATFVEFNQGFHGAVANMTGNPRIAVVEHDLVEQFARLVRVTLRVFKGNEIRHLAAEHDAIIDAIQDHDANLAHQLAYEHVLGGQTRVFTALRMIAEAEENSARPPAKTETKSNDSR
jgi:DNA-binding GntR family transcriptional regulator